MRCLKLHHCTSPNKVFYWYGPLIAYKRPGRILNKSSYRKCNNHHDHWNHQNNCSQLPLCMRFHCKCQGSSLARIGMRGELLSKNIRIFFIIPNRLTLFSGWTQVPVFWSDNHLARRKGRVWVVPRLAGQHWKSGRTELLVKIWEKRRIQHLVLDWWYETRFLPLFFV